MISNRYDTYNQFFSRFQGFNEKLVITRTERVVSPCLSVLQMDDLLQAMRIEVSMPLTAGQ